MAITRAQQAKQMLQDGGRIGFKGGADMGTVSGQMRAATAKSVNVSPSGAVRTSQTSGPPSQSSADRDTGLERERQRNISKLNKFLSTKPEVPKAPPLGPFSIATNLFNKQLQQFSDFTTAKNRKQFEKAIRAGKIKGLNFATLDDLTEEELEQKYQDYMSARLNNEIDAFGNPIGSVGGEGGINQVIPVDTTFAQIPSNMNQEIDTTEDDTDDRFIRFRADGGPIGGEFDFESARQMYGLGKLVKKATRAVKKIAKSPIGKIALIGGGLGLAGIGPFEGLRRTALGKGLAGFFGEGSFNPFKMMMTTAPNPGSLVSSPFARFLSSGKGAATLIGGASAVAGLLTPEQEAEAQRISDETGIDIEEVRNSILAAGREQYAMDFRARGFKADGGLMRLGYQEGSKEPVAKKTMPLLDMGGKEMDLREDGGFVPIGRMEKADDVPARLSKNEFVFTAEAVRNAGDGDVDKGAEVMYNMMKNLESGGDVSEESQGLKGAREMFQTSQRLGEVL